MPERYDVVVVGARCAGAALAFRLARAGLSVALVDRAHFPSDTLSTHFFQTPGVVALERMGLLDALQATGAPLIYTVDYRLGDVAGVGPFGKSDEERQGPGWCVRRTVLDTALVRAAEGAGATVRTGCRVTGLTTAGERVTGVVAIDDAGREVQLDAAIVVGADGTGSTVARMVGARRYHTQPNQRLFYWGYFEGASEPGPPALFYHRFDDHLFVGSPCDEGLYMAAVLPSLGELPAYSDDLEAAFGATVARCEAFAAILDGAQRVGPFRGTATFPGFFREPVGAGWVLLGDAGHFKDPAAGQGISDAFRQAERLADDIMRGLGGGSSPDAVLADWWRWRDAEEFELHWLAADMGAAGPVLVLLGEVVRELQESPGGLFDFWGIFHHRVRPSEVLTPERLGGAAARLAGTSLEPQAHAELAAMVDMAEARAKLAESPVYEDDGPRLAAARSA
jgi:2-polyprenyl-6-methoxyphenol hydroxylase-like FAD-dependent oxidoreductase